MTGRPVRRFFRPAVLIGLPLAAAGAFGIALAQAPPQPAHRTSLKLPPRPQAAPAGPDAATAVPPPDAPAPPLSTDKAFGKTTTAEAPPPVPDSYPGTRGDQIRAIQMMLRDLKIMNRPPTGELGPVTIAAIRDYQRSAGLPESGEPSQELFDSLKTARSQQEKKPDKPE